MIVVTDQRTAWGSGRKKEAAGAFGDESPREPEAGKGDEAEHRRHEHSPRTRRKWRHALRLFGTKRLKEGAM
jgi:hypothetical protein